MAVILNKVESAEDIKITIRDKRLAFYKECPGYRPRYVILSEWQRRLLSEVDMYFVNDDGFLSQRIYDLIICVSPKIREIEDIQVF